MAVAPPVGPVGRKELPSTGTPWKRRRKSSQAGSRTRLTRFASTRRPWKRQLPELTSGSRSWNGRKKRQQKPWKRLTRPRRRPRQTRRRPGGGLAARAKLRWLRRSPRKRAGVASRSPWKRARAEAAAAPLARASWELALLCSGPRLSRQKRKEAGPGPREVAGGHGAGSA